MKTYEILKNLKIPPKRQTSNVYAGLLYTKDCIYAFGSAGREVVPGGRLTKARC